ncbi:MAG: YjfI family protein [Sneathiellales bacterium]|nr:YjfI family protein [Sneathiellales bacterium]
MTKEKASSAARQKKLRQKRRDMGLVKVEVWVPPSGRKAIRELETQINNKHLVLNKEGTNLMPKLTTSDLFTQLSATEEAKNGEISVSTIEGDTPVIQTIVEDIDEFPILISVGEEQVLVIVNLWTEAEIKEGEKNALNEYLLRLNLPVPLSSFSIINDQYVLFGALSVNSSISEILEEISTLSNNVIEALESCQDFLKT